MAKHVDSSGAGPLDALCDAYLRQFRAAEGADFAELVTEFMAPLPAEPVASGDMSANAPSGAEPGEHANRRSAARKRQSFREHADTA
jgi:hypothetical protein